MSKYKGLFTFDVENHKYLPVEQADGIIDCMVYDPSESTGLPLIKDKKIREVIRLWAKVNDVYELTYDESGDSLNDIFRNTICFNGLLGLEDGRSYLIAELCGEAEK